MSKGMSGGVVVLLMIVAAIAGGLAGYFIPRSSDGGDHDISTEGRIDYACEMVLEMKDVEFDLDDWGQPARQEVFKDVTTIAGLFGGFGMPQTDIQSIEEEYGYDLYMSMARLDLELMTETMDDVIEYCEAR